MLDFIKIKNDLQDSFNREKSKGVDIDIQDNVINEDNGKFSLVFLMKMSVTQSAFTQKADITVGFVNKDTMIDMFTQSE